MPTLAWRDDFAFAQPRMDDTHREFVDLLGALEATTSADAATQALHALQEHTEAHFAQEERWMAALGFEAENCHSMQHRNVLEVVREVGRRHAQAWDADLVASLVKALAEWFPTHALMLDAALAETMVERGFDPDAAPDSRPPAPTAALDGALAAGRAPCACPTAEETARA